ncbi:TM181-like protein [Mya arenaria]|uniref:TM181-like protein n=1 Tax=Mya arenaria TaxID=6604 RepID=A0ABY7EF93_MYAAR|nr:TM181-like protein [Mya arenaria]
MDVTYTFSGKPSGPSWGNGARAFLTQFSDVFSAFGKYIAPSYKHDRCERSVQMRLYSLNKRQFVMVFVTFLMCFGITVLIGIAGPPIIETVSYNLSAMTQGDPNINMKTGPFALKSPPLTTFHQQFWLVAHIITDNTEGTRIEQSFTVSVFIGGIKAEDSSLLQGDNPECRDLILLHLGYLDYTSYVINVNFHGLEQQAHFNIKNIIFYFKSYNTAFTKLEIWLSACFPIRYANSLCEIDPLFPLTFLVNSWIPGMFDAIFQSSFLCGLLLFWLCIYHGVRQTDRRFWKFYSLKVLIVGLIWISAVTLSSWQEYNELQDPTYFYRLDTSNFMGFKIFFFIVGGIYLLYLLYLLVRAITITVLRFGRAALQDNFVAELSTHYQNSAEFVAFYETHFKDNPGLSMLNDSDEEVHYGIYL